MFAVYSIMEEVVGYEQIGKKGKFNQNN